MTSGSEKACQRHRPLQHWGAGVRNLYPVLGKPLVCFHLHANQSTSSCLQGRCNLRQNPPILRYIPCSFYKFVATRSHPPTWAWRIPLPALKPVHCHEQGGRRTLWSNRTCNRYSAPLPWLLAMDGDRNCFRPAHILSTTRLGHLSEIYPRLFFRSS